MGTKSNEHEGNSNQSQTGGSPTEGSGDPTSASELPVSLDIRGHVVVVIMLVIWLLIFCAGTLINSEPYFSTTQAPRYIKTPFKLMAVSVSSKTGSLTSWPWYPAMESPK